MSRLPPLLLLLLLTVPPGAAAQGRGDIVREALDRGNALLEKGKPAQARDEYAKALMRLPPDQQGPVLRAIARCFYVEEKVEAAARVLRLAVLVDPEDATGRQLLALTLENAGRAEEARAFLQRLDDEGAAALLAELPPEQRPGFLQSVRLEDGVEAEAARPGRRGSYRVGFEQHHPKSSLDVFFERHRMTAKEQRRMDASAYALREESFEVHVPENAVDEPFGLLVWVAPIPMGNPPDELLPVLASRRMIWIGANSSGNARPPWDRMGLALDAVHNMKELYNVDERRIYVGGYSGGGRMASRLAVLYPDVFRGAFLFMGCDYYREVPFPGEPRKRWPAAFHLPDREILRQAKENRFAFVTGDDDFNRSQTETYHRRYRQDGFEHVHYLQIPGADHYYGVRAEWLEKGLAFLDGDATPPLR